MHSTLARQLLKFFEDPHSLPKNSKAWKDFLKAVSQTYDGYEQDHELIERSLDLSSKELGEQNAKLHSQTEKLEKQVIQIKKQKKRADEEKALDEALLSSIGEGVLATDKRGTIVMMNGPAETLLKYKKDELIGEPIQKISPSPAETEQEEKVKRERTFAEELHAQVLTGGKKLVSASARADDFEFTKKNKTTFPAFITATPVISKRKTIGSILIFHDATRDREVDRMKTEFISLASHQLRTPLSAIKWFSEMLAAGDAGKLNSEQQDFTQNIVDSTERMIELVSSLLNISRIESGRIIVNPKPTDLKQLLDGLVKELQVKFQQKKQSLAISVHSDLPEINLDPQLIRQVYLNFLTNAIKYSPKGGEIHVLVSRKNDEVISQITDNGFGIPKEEQHKLFQKFFRATNIAKFETDGTGLGMYLVKSIIESSKGKIWYKSEEGKGTTFWFSLPITGMTAKKGEVVLDMKR